MTDRAEAATQAPVLAVDRVSHRYGRRVALEEVTFAIGRGEILCLFGPSGCGKTTALRIVAGLEAPSSGTVALAGRIVSGLGVQVAPEHRGVGYLSQDLALFPHLDVIGNVAFGLDALPRAERRARALAMLEQVGMADYAEAWPHHLSGGQQQRVALARALAPAPKLMLLDEPFSSLDRTLRDRIWEDALSALRASEVATLMVTHDPQEAMAMADRIAVMREGRIVQSGAPEDIYDRPTEPYVARQFGEVNSLSGAVQGGAIKTAIGDIAAPGLAEGAAARVLIRSEALRPVAAPEGPARLVSVRSLGAALVLRLAVAGAPGAEPLIAQVPRGPMPEIGARVGFEVDPRGVFVFPSED